MADTPRQKRKLRLPEKILLALGLAVATGVFFGDLVGWLEVVGNIFIRLLQITVIPFISLSLITGLGTLTYDEIRRLALKGGSVLLLLWATVLSVVLLIPAAFPDWPSGSFFSTSLVEQPDAPDFLQLFIPSNPFFSYANALVPAVVMFSILIGVALIGSEKKATAIDFLSVIRDALMRITGWIAQLAPYGVFALIASAVGTIDIGDLARLQVYLVLYALLALLLSLWVIPALVTVVTPLRYRDVLRALRTPLITAFATGSSLIVVPMLIEQCKELVRESMFLGADESEDVESAMKVLIPTSFPFPSAGALMILSFPLFAGWFMGSAVSSSTIPSLVAAGVPSLFGGSMLAVPFLLELANLPGNLFQVFVAVDVINSRFSTLLAAMHYAAIGMIGTMALVARLRIRWVALIRFASMSIVLLAGVLFGVRAFYTHVVVVPSTAGTAMTQLHMMGERQPAIIRTNISTAFERERAQPASFEEIVDSGVLRACFQPAEYPSAFVNDASPPELVGFDIEMTHRLARRANLTIEFLPTRNEIQAAQFLESGICDIYMRNLPISAGRTRMFGLTQPIFRSSLGLIVPGHVDDRFRTWEALRDLGAELQIGVDGSADSQSLIRSLLPEAQKTPIEDLEVQRRILASGAKDVNAIVDLAEEGAALTLLYPRFSIVVPRPIVFVPVAYAVARDNRDLLEAINAWLVTEIAKGTTDDLYEYWMLGGALQRERPPRWSVIRNVLGWVD